MTSTWSRRGVLGATVAAASFGRQRRARAAGRTLNVLCHRVHQLCLTTGVAGNLTEDWKRANGAEITWTTFDTDPLQDRLFREAHLPETEFGVAYLVNSRATEDAAKLLQPLDAYQSSAPVEEFSDIASGLVQGMTVGGKLVGIPVRHATQGLFYNEALLESRGIT